jgi:hypothetical protein
VTRRLAGGSGITAGTGTGGFGMLAPPAPPSHEPRKSSPALGDMLWEVADLLGGAVITFLPLLLIAVPGVVLFVVLPALVLLAVAAVPVVVAGVVLLPAYVPTRSARRALGARRRDPRRLATRMAPA